jgi:hypothetical protein
VNTFCEVFLTKYLGTTFLVRIPNF